MYIIIENILILIVVVRIFALIVHAQFSKTKYFGYLNYTVKT